MQTPEFDHALQLVMEYAKSRRVALMCAEAVPWRCHRSLIGDALEARGLPVFEIATASRAAPHRMTPFAKVEGTKVTYPIRHNSLRIKIRILVAGSRIAAHHGVGRFVSRLPAGLSFFGPA